MSLDAFMDDFGRDLQRAAARPPRRTRRRLLVAVPAATGLAAVGVVLLPRGDGIDAIAEARQALAPGNEIVHMVIEFKPPAGRGPRVTMPKTEQWFATGPDRWRTRTQLGTQGNQFEQIVSNHRVRLYDKRKDVVRIFTGVKMISAAGPGLTGGDPATELRRELAAGDVRDDGVVTHEGRQVRRLVRDKKIGRSNTQRFVYYMDPKTFAPLGGRMYFDFASNRRIVAEFTISGYERIPLNEQTKKLLTFAKTPDTKYVWRDFTRRARSSSARARARRQG